ncbi:MAG: type II toxin-antitoxin system PemK/MazF family toxin [Acidimicrobiales bacterium]
MHDVDLGQPVGHEPAFLRPAVVVSVDILDNGPGQLVVVVPVTSGSLPTFEFAAHRSATGATRHASMSRCKRRA